METERIVTTPPDTAELPVESVPTPPISGTDTPPPTETAPETAPETDTPPAEEALNPLLEDVGQTSGQEGLVELTEVPVRPILTTPLHDYTVTEGLLLCILLVLVLGAVLRLVRG